jgi:Peptidase family M28
MRARETISQLTGFAGRGPGTDAERRAANWLAKELEDANRDVRLEPFWCRPNWALAHAWHVALALAGSLISVSNPWIGGALILAALLSVIADDRLGISLGRRLTPERASQNVVSAPVNGAAENQARLIITANYDAGRTGLVYRPRLRAAAARLKRATGGRAPGWLAWLTIALAWLLITAALRIAGAKGTAIAVAQLPPTAALVLGLALLVELGTASFGPAAGDNASGTAVAVVIARALATAAPRHVAVNLVLAGAGEGPGIGLKHYLRQHKRMLNRENTAVLGIAPCAAGRLRWWTSDGTLAPRAYDSRLRRLCGDLAAKEPELGASPHRGRGATPALPARAARLPAIAIGCVDERGLVPHSHQRTDTPETAQEDAVGATVEFGLILVDAIDSRFRGLGTTAQPAPTPA